jgi:5-methylcytosine-specific restriction protein B
VGLTIGLSGRFFLKGGKILWSDKLLAAVMQKGYSADWFATIKQGFEGLYGSKTGRYRESAEKTVKVRVSERPMSNDDSFVPFAALINPKNPESSIYSGMSIAIFPVPEARSLISFVVGTGGLGEDERVLGRAGHARKVKAICAWLNKKHGRGRLCAWSKQDPTRTDQPLPDNVAALFPEYARVFKRYGDVLYGIFAPPSDPAGASDALTAFLDLMFEERGEFPLSPYLDEGSKLKREWLGSLMPDANSSSVAQLLADRRYVILQGPPGTGKTRMALELIKDRYLGRGQTIQFHANTTYEDFVGGLAPRDDSSSLGLRFAPKRGILLDAVEEAKKSKGNYLLHIDEINRADMSKVLGEAIYLLESDEAEPRQLKLTHDFGPEFKDGLKLPPNLHIIGTMNTADRSLAILDVAVRRRFAFQKMWPQMAIAEQAGACETMKKAFQGLVSIFVEHATDENFDLMPGHSYFLEKDEGKAPSRLKVTLAPLLEEYLAQGYVASFAEPIRSYLQWIESL